MGRPLEVFGDDMGLVSMIAASTCGKVMMTEWGPGHRDPFGKLRKREQAGRTHSGNSVH